jgi:hypothetical protein
VALAILPLFVEGCRLGAKFRRKLCTFQHYIEPVQEAQVIFEVQVRSFLHECELVLRDVVKDSDIPGVRMKVLMSDFDDDLWSSPELEERFQSYLGTSKGPFKNLVKLIGKKIAKIEGDLSRFDEVDEEGEVSSPRHSYCSNFSGHTLFYILYTMSFLFFFYAIN